MEVIIGAGEFEATYNNGLIVETNGYIFYSWQTSGLVGSCLSDSHGMASRGVAFALVVGPL